MPRMHDRALEVRLVVEGIEFEGRHGVYEEERQKGNRFRADIEMFGNLEPAAESDRLEDTVDVASVVRCVQKVNSERSFNLIESLAGAISNALLDEFPQPDEVRVRVRKLSPQGLGEHACAVAEVRERRSRDG
jgi:dihydroneopterin aldolase